MNKKRIEALIHGLDTESENQHNSNDPHKEDIEPLLNKLKECIACAKKIRENMDSIKGKKL